MTRVATQFDQHGEGVNFKVKGKATLPSVFGTMLSLLSLGILIAYATDKYTVMTSYSDTAYTSKQRALLSSDTTEYNAETTGVYMAWLVENTTSGEIIPAVNVSQYVYPEVKVLTIEPNEYDVVEDLIVRACNEADLTQLFFKPQG